MLVLDASVAFAFSFEDENSAIADLAIDNVKTGGAVVPVHWYSEIANGLLMAVRRNRMSSAFRKIAFNVLHDLPIHLDTQDQKAVWQAGIELAEKHGLTAYDAAYLELALRRKLPLASLDKSLIRAAKAEKVEIIGNTE